MKLRFVNIDGYDSKQTINCFALYFFYNIKTDIVKNKNSPYNSTFFIALLSQ